MKQTDEKPTDEDTQHRNDETIQRGLAELDGRRVRCWVSEGVGYEEVC